MGNRRFICMVCGFEVELNRYWIEKARSYKCPACDSDKDWKMIPLVSIPKEIKKKREDDTWKKLLIARHPRKFKNGYFKPSKEWVKYNEWLEDIREEGLREFVKQFTRYGN